MKIEDLVWFVPSIWMALLKLQSRVFWNFLLFRKSYENKFNKLCLVRNSRDVHLLLSHAKAWRHESSHTMLLDQFQWKNVLSWWLLFCYGKLNNNSFCCFSVVSSFSPWAGKNNAHTFLSAYRRYQQIYQLFNDTIYCWTV